MEFKIGRESQWKATSCFRRSLFERRRLMPVALRFAVIFGIMLGFFGTASIASSASTSLKKKAAKYPTVALAQYDETNIYTGMAMEAAFNGPFSKYGFNAQFIPTTPADIVAPYLNGQETMGSLSGSTVVSAIIDGAPIRIIGNLFPGAFFEVLAAPSITKVSQLKNQRIAVTSTSGAFDEYMSSFLPKLGVPNSSWIPDPLGSFANITAAALAGDIKVVPEEPGASADALLAAGWHVLIKPSQIKTTGSVNVLVATVSEIKNHPAVVQRYVDAIVAGAKLFHDNRNLGLQLLNEEPYQTPIKALDEIQQEYAYYKPLTVCYPYAYRSQFSYADAFLARTIPAAGQFKVASYIDDNFVKTAQKNKIGC